MFRLEVDKNNKSLARTYYYQILLFLNSYLNVNKIIIYNNEEMSGSSKVDMSYIKHETDLTICFYGSSLEKLSWWYYGTYKSKALTKLTNKDCYVIGKHNRDHIDKYLVKVSALKEVTIIMRNTDFDVKVINTLCTDIKFNRDDNYFLLNGAPVFMEDYTVVDVIELEDLLDTIELDFDESRELINTNKLMVDGDLEENGLYLFISDDYIAVKRVIDVDVLEDNSYLYTFDDVNIKRLG